METKNRNSTPEIRSGIKLQWLNDINRAVQVLTGLSIRFSAQAALITKGKALWAYAGQLPQAAAEELGNTIIHYADIEEGTDLMRFIQLDATSEEHKIYATQLASECTVALVYNNETPFSVIRAQAAEMVKALANDQSKLVDGQGRTKNRANINTNTLKKILTNNSTISNHGNAESKSPMETNELRNNEPDYVGYEGKNQPTRSDPSQGPEMKRRIRFEESSQAMYNLNYACLLIPRFPNHQMIGDLSMRLSEWLPKICVAYGWRLEQISVQKDHFQWIVSVSPTTAPGYLMRIIRKKLSEKIFEDFPRIRNENPSGDFWAPGYILTGSSNLHPAHLVREFIEETRARQGIS